MALSLGDCSVFGPALPEPFLQFHLETHLQNAKLLPKSGSPEAKLVAEQWDAVKRRLKMLGDQGRALRVANHVLEPLAGRLGYCSPTRVEEVSTREGMEDGGFILASQDGAAHLRAWTVDVGDDLDAPSRRGRAYRFSPSRIAQRVLLATGERIGLLTDGSELRILFCDPARPDSHLSIRLDRVGGWRGAQHVPDSYRVFLALACPSGVAHVPDLVEHARRSQTSVTTKLREQAKQAIVGFVQGLLDDPSNFDLLRHAQSDSDIPKKLWSESLVLIYRLLFILKLEASPDPARAFSFRSASIWQKTFSPKRALADLVDSRRKGLETGSMIGDGLRMLFRLFQTGVESSALKVSPLGGMLFGTDSTPLLDTLAWSEDAAGTFLDRLLWTPGEKGSGRQRVHYGSLDVEDLGRVYEALLELEPGIAAEPMCRLRRQKLEVVVSAAKGEAYAAAPIPDEQDDEGGGGAQEEEDEESSRGKNRVQWIERIPAGRFYLRVGLGRKATGSYYTPDPFVRFLIQETLGPQVANRSPPDDPNPAAILALNVLDPATGSGHFLVGACRFLGEKLYEACRLCDERALELEEQAATASEPEGQLLRVRAAALRKRVEDLPDPNNELSAYLPSRIAEGEESGVSQWKALALCRRLVAVHCLYGVDKNPLALELAKLSLWLESYAEGLPLTFLDHRIVCGDSLTGPFFDDLLTYPGSGERIENLFAEGVTEKLTKVLEEALVYVRDLEATVGKDVADIEHKRRAKRKLDVALRPLKTLAAAWAGGVMLGKDHCDDAGYEHLLTSIAERQDEAAPSSKPGIAQMIQTGLKGVSYDLVFPEVFHPDGAAERSGGFDAVIGNPPWDKLRVERRDFMAAIEPRYLVGKEAAGVGDEHIELERAFNNSDLATSYAEELQRTKRIAVTLAGSDDLSRRAVRSTSDPDLYKLFLLRCRRFVRITGRLGFVVGGGLAKIPSDTELRRWVFGQFNVTHFLHYVNLRQLFGGASSRISFVCLVGAPTGTASCHIGFELSTFDDLVDASKVHVLLNSTIASRLEADGDLTKVRMADGVEPTLQSACDALSGLISLGIEPIADLHRTSDKEALRSIEDAHVGGRDARTPDAMRVILPKGFAPLYAGRSIDDFDAFPTEKSGKWDPAVVEVVALRHPKVASLRNMIPFYRFTWRATCGLVATNERSARACLLPPGAAAGDSLRSEGKASARPNASALIALTVFNSFSFDWAARRVVQSNLNKGVLRMLPWPVLPESIRTYLAHSALRLSCVHEGYEPLWQEQLSTTWRESVSKFSWPVLKGLDARWAVRAGLDAAVADAFGLSRDEYQTILRSFPHRSYADAPALCLDAFDELRNTGHESFVKKRDPYSEVPLVETLPTRASNLGLLMSVGDDASHDAVDAEVSSNEKKPKRKPQ